MKTSEILAMGPVMPVIVIDDAKQAVPLADALISGGINAIEITLRTPAALDAIRAVADARPNMAVGAGTILGPDDAVAAAEAGAVFAVSPGATDAIVYGCKDVSLPLLPGAATVSEILKLGEQGFDCLKFFPAAASGGVPFLKSLSSPMPGFTFCPTGGISLETAPDYLALENVPCVGGSWIAPADLIAKGDFEEIGARAGKAAQLTSRLQ